MNTNIYFFSKYGFINGLKIGNLLHVNEYLPNLIVRNKTIGISINSFIYTDNFELGYNIMPIIYDRNNYKFQLDIGCNIDNGKFYKARIKYFYSNDVFYDIEKIENINIITKHLHQDQYKKYMINKTVDDYINNTDLIISNNHHIIKLHKPNIDKIKIFKILFSS